MSQYPSFKAQYGRKPIADKDYDSDGTICQDDYEYLTGTGRYSDKPSVATPDERRFLRREFITDYLRTGTKSSDEIKGFVRLAERTQFGYELINYSPWDGFDFGGGIDDPRY